VVFPGTGRGVAWGISGGPSGPKTAIQVNQRIHPSTSRFTAAAESVAPRILGCSQLGVSANEGHVRLCL